MTSPKSSIFDSYREGKAPIFPPNAGQLQHMKVPCTLNRGARLPSLTSGHSDMQDAGGVLEADP